ncbi:MAG: ribbon-helix-helix domain-containing protein [Thauera sp.]|jgi:predicted transcriptional regulator|nr:ribbon-helix-helix domain-containing protein [Thauera sp.]
MHFNIYLDDHTGQQLNALAKEAGQSRNALIREAISQWLGQYGQSQWPQAVQDFTGLADMPTFESYRSELLPAADDPLA